MQAQGKRYVLVAQGLYRENVRLFDGAQLFGGYSLGLPQARSASCTRRSWSASQPTGGALAALHAEALGTGAVETVVSGFTIVGLGRGRRPRPTGRQARRRSPCT